MAQFEKFFDAVKNILVGQRRTIRDLERRVRQIKTHESRYRAFSQPEFRLVSEGFKTRFQAGETLELLLPECFAVVKEAIKRALNIDVRDAQLLGGVAMHHGSIVELATGEGKSLMVLFPAYLHSLAGDGVHIATLNRYLAARDHAQADRVLSMLGCSVGLLDPRAKPATRRQAYACDITYSVYDEFARDYLRDNTQMTVADLVQRGHASAFLDEIDAILIDEARAPVTLSETYEPSDRLYRGVQAVIAALPEESSEIDTETNAVFLTEKGQDDVEAALRSAGLLDESGSIYDQNNIDLSHHVQKALQARYLYSRDKDYVVINGHIVLVDPVTGRAMPGRRFGDGLHQALEAKEGVSLGPETQTLSTISVQNYFRIYKSRSGMTATAIENANEFYEVYRLRVLQLPSTKPLKRIDLPDQFFETAEKKIETVTTKIAEAYGRNQPVLVGTTSIRQSDEISRKLKALSIDHNMLTARHDADEASVIANAGLPRAVTIAANMAGRGTDIFLGGPPPQHDASEAEIAAHRLRRQDVLDAGGLLVIGTEKHDSRRLDQQLRGRAGRQGDVGTTVFMLSLEDDFVRPILKQKPDYFKSRNALSHYDQQWIHSFFSAHQKNVEESHSQMRIQLMKFDDIVHKQRQVIFAERLRLMKDDDLNAIVSAMREQVINDLIDRYIVGRSFLDEETTELFRQDCIDLFGFEVHDFERIASALSAHEMDDNKVREILHEQADLLVAKRRTEFGHELSSSLERQAVLNAIDTRWNEHQRIMERLRSVIGLRAEGRRDPYTEYQTEAFDLFESMLAQLRLDVTRSLARARPLDSKQQMQAIENLLFDVTAA